MAARREAELNGQEFDEVKYDFALKYCPIIMNMYVMTTAMMLSLFEVCGMDDCLLSCPDIQTLGGIFRYAGS